MTNLLFIDYGFENYRGRFLEELRLRGFEINCITQKETRIVNPAIRFKQIGFIGYESSLRGFQELMRMPHLLYSIKKINPAVIIVGNMGINSLASIIYSKVFQVPVIVWARLSVWTEKNRSPLTSIYRRCILFMSKSIIVNSQSGSRYISTLSKTYIHVIPQVSNIEQKLYYADDLNHKHRLLTHFLNDPEIKQAIVFTSTKRFADRLVDDLAESGCHDAAALHGDMDQRQRTRTIQRLRDGHIRFLIATDVAARGIDISTISHVINFDLPMSAEDYVHRIGRTGRAGSSGIALSIAGFSDRHLVARIEQFTGQQIDSHTVPGMEPSVRSRPSRPNNGSSRGGGGGGGRPPRSRARSQSR